MVRSIAWQSEKGGSGKSTSCINTAHALARTRKRVLVVDADPQANTTLVLMRGQAPDPPTLHEVLMGAGDPGDAIRATGIPNLDILPSVAGLADVNLSLADAVGRERRFRLAMRGIEDDYDFVVVDTSPSRSLINVNVLNYVREVYCPVEPGIFSLAGLVSLQAAIASVVSYLDNSELRLTGLVLTQARGDNLTRDCEAQLRATFGSLVFQATIPQSVKVGEAHSRYQTVLDYAPRSPAAKAYEALTREMLSHGVAEHRLGIGGGGNVPADGNRAARRRRAAG